MQNAILFWFSTEKSMDTCYLLLFLFKCLKQIVYNYIYLSTLTLKKANNY